MKDAGPSPTANKKCVGQVKVLQILHTKKYSFGQVIVGSLSQFLGIKESSLAQYAWLTW